MSTLTEKLARTKERLEDTEGELSLQVARREAAEEQVLRLEKQRDQAESSLATKVRALESMTISRDWYSNRANELLNELNQTKASLSRAHDTPVTRAQLEGLTRIRLVSLIEEAINEARRKGLVEVEGLLSRHRELTESTDLEMMRGVVKTYQDRIIQVEAASLARRRTAQTPVKLDTRPFSEKLQPAVTPPVASFREFSTRVDRMANDTRATQFISGSKVTVAGSKGGTYILSRTGNVWRCSCPAWQFAQLPAEKRTCKHLRGYFGERTEDDRIAAAVVPANTNNCWCGEALVRGQCQVHTRDWKGSENCECGRTFASCKAAFDTLSVVQRRKGHKPRLAAPKPRFYW